MKKDLRLSELCDLYGQLLTPRQREIITGYYDYDLSLAEISENYGITRQAVRDAIVKASEQLSYYEEILGVYRERERVLALSREIISLIDEGDIVSAKQKASQLIGKV